MIKKMLRATFIVAFYLLQLPTWADESVVIPDVKLKSQITNEKKSTAAIAATTFNRVEIKKSPVINLSQFLKQEQSVVRLTKNSADPGQTAISIRGFGSNAAANSLILVDGFPLTNPSLLPPNFNSIPLPDIARIEIFQGSGGSLWGDQAVGGVVNIITKHPQKFFTNAILSVGSYHNFYDNILVGDKFENGLFFKVFALVGKTNNYRQHNQQSANNIAVQVGKDYASGMISINLQSYADSTYFPGGLTEEEFIHHPRIATDFHNHSRYRTNLFQILNIQELNSEWILETRLDHHATNGDGFFFWNFNRDDSMTSINPRLIGKINKNKIILGYFGQHSYYQLKNAKVQTRAFANQNNIYMQTTIPLTQQLEFIFGARKAWQANRFEEHWGQPAFALDQVFVTEEGLVFHPNNELSLFIRRDGNFRFPKANEETWLPEHVNSLTMQTGTSYEAGTTWQKEKFKTQLSVYHLVLHDELAFNPAETPDHPFGSFSNFDKTIRNGFSLTQHIQLSEAAMLHSQINYVNARFATGYFAGNWIPAVPAINANAGLDYSWSDHWLLQYNLLYTGSRYPTDDVENIAKKIPGYWLSDVALQYFFKSYIFVFEIQNLFNKNYANYVLYNAANKQNIYYPAAGRNFLLTLKINLD